MRIVNLQVHSIAIADPPLRSSYGLHAPYALRNILELTSEDGIVGIAETYGGHAPAQALEALRSQVVGADAYRLTGRLMPLLEGQGEGLTRSQTYLVPGENPLDATTRTYAAIETACLDLIGKSIGKQLQTELSDGGYLEDPTSTLEGMAEVRKELLAAGVDTPLASNVAVTSFADIPVSLQLDATQIILCDHHYWGGMRQVQNLAALCRVFNLGLSMHSNSHLGVSLMAMAHVAAATPHLTYACDTHYPWQSARDEIVAGGRIPIKDGYVEVSDEPGLGVGLDYDQLARGRERYAKLSYRKRDDEAEMQKHVDPTWKRVLPRW